MVTPPPEGNGETAAGDRRAARLDVIPYGMANS